MYFCWRNRWWDKFDRTWLELDAETRSGKLLIDERPCAKIPETWWLLLNTFGVAPLERNAVYSCWIIENLCMIWQEHWFRERLEARARGRGYWIEAKRRIWLQRIRGTDKSRKGVPGLFEKPNIIVGTGQRDTLLGLLPGQLFQEQVLS